MERTEEEVATGFLSITVGGIAKAVPTLKIKDIPEWTRLLDALTPSVTAEDPSEGYTLVAKVTIAGLLELATAYDKTGALGGREWLEANADPAELHAAVLQMAGNVFPLGDAVAVVASTLREQVRETAARLAPLSSTNDASTSGDSPPTPSARRSTRSS